MTDLNEREALAGSLGMVAAVTLSATAVLETATQILSALTAPTITEKEPHNDYDHNQRRCPDLLQRLGPRPTHCLPPWLAAQLGRLGYPNAVLRPAWLSRDRYRPSRPRTLEPGVGRP